MSNDLASMNTIDLLKQERDGTTTERRAAMAETIRRYDAARIARAQLADASTEALIEELRRRELERPTLYDRFALNTLVEMLNDLGYGPIADRILACRIGGYDRPLRSMDAPFLCVLCRRGREERLPFEDGDG